MARNGLVQVNDRSQTAVSSSVDGAVPEKETAPGSGITQPDSGSAETQTVSTVRSLRELVDRVSGRGFKPSDTEGDAGLAEVLPFPFLAMVGQTEMKLALLLCLVNPAIGGALLIGPRGTGKTTAVRSLVDLLPMVPRSLCYYGCLPEDVETDGIDAVCPDCAKKICNGRAAFQDGPGPLGRAASQRPPRGCCWRPG